MTIGVTPRDGTPQLSSVSGSGANPVHAASIARRLGAAVMAALYVALLPAVAVGTPADPLEGVIVREIRVIGLSDLPPAAVTRHLASKAGAPFRRANVAIDTRRLDELRLFSTVRVEPSLDGGDVVIDVKVKQTLRILPTIALRVTDANGLSAGAGMRSINLFGHGAQAGVSALFGGETAVGGVVDTTTITPGTWAVHTALNYTSRENTLYDYHERATSAELRPSRNFNHGVRVGGVASLLVDDTGSSDVSLSPDGTDVMPTFGTFLTLDTLDSSTNPRNGTWAEGEIDYVVGDARSWTFIADGRRFQHLSARHGVAAFALASFQTGEVGETLPEYLQFALGGANTVRGWSLGSRTGRNQFIGTAEYTFVARQVAPFSIFGFNAYGGLQLVAFADTGLAWNHSADRQSAITGYGAGLRVLVPFVDLVRIDVAWGEPGQGAAAYFGISLKAARQRQRVR
jgi:outer membrane protein assembly factor BamA